MPRGWAIECRITSEDPANGFLPSTGRISYLHLPSGPGVRWDGGIEVGSEIGLFYDPMLAKLIVHAPTREAAIERMHRALLELTIEGVESSRDFHLRVMEDAEFRAGAIEIQWLERRLDSLIQREAAGATIARTAAVVAALIADRDRQAPKRSDAAVDRERRRSSDAWLRAARLRRAAMTRRRSDDRVASPRAATGSRRPKASSSSCRARRRVIARACASTLEKRFARGDVEELARRRRRERVDPLCYHYRMDQCGGCQLQHMRYDAQLEAKRGIIRDALTRIGKRAVELPDDRAERKRVALSPQAHARDAPRARRRVGDRTASVRRSGRRLSARRLSDHRRARDGRVATGDGGADALSARRRAARVRAAARTTARRS